MTVEREVLGLDHEVEVAHERGSQRIEHRARHLDHAPTLGATLPLDTIVLVARSLGGGRVNVVGLRLPEDEVPAVRLTPGGALRRRTAEIWASLAGY